MQLYFRAVLALLLATASAVAQPRPLTNVHAHNDYEHTRPLLDALDHGFCSVEADVHLVNGELLVAHSRSQVKPGRTLQSLYLNPLRQRVLQNGGHVYPNGPEFTLLIDIKGDWRTTYPVLRAIFQDYTNILTSFDADGKHTRAITAILTGNRSTEMFKGEALRYAAMDGDLPDLDSNEPATLIPWISSHWTVHFKWRGTGAIPESEKKKLLDIVARAHQQGRRVRFWGAPDQPAFWRELMNDGVDLLNTDDLAGMEKFLNAQAPATGKAR